MKEVNQERRKPLIFLSRFLRSLIDARVIIGVTGLIMSVVLHELFHVMRHLGHITSFRILPNPTTLVQIVAITPPGYDLMLEEMEAYTITVLVLFITIIAVWKIHDKKDKRSFSDTLMPKGGDLRQLQAYAKLLG